MASFDFVTISRPDEIAESSAKRLIRSRAMRYYRQQQKLEKHRLVGRGGRAKAEVVLRNVPRHLRHPPNDYGGEMSNPNQLQEIQCATCDDGPPSDASSGTAAAATCQVLALSPSRQLAQRQCSQGQAARSGAGTTRSPSPSYYYAIADKYVDTGLQYSAHLPIGSPTYALEFVNHFSTFLAPKLVEMSSTNPTHILISAAVNDKGLFDGLLYMSSSHIDSLRGETSCFLTLSHHVRMLQYIDEGLRKSTAAPTDFTISATLSLANFENMSGHVHVSQVHMQALHRMVKIRGGHAKLGLNGVLSRMIILSDVMATSLRESDYSTSPSNPKKMLPRVFSLGILPIRATITDPVEYSRSLRTYGISWRSISLLKMFRDVTAMLEPIYLGKATNKTIRSLFGTFTEMHEHLLSLPSADELKDSSPRTDFVYESCRLAGHIYLGSIVSSSPISSIANERYVLELRAALEKTDLQNSWGPVPEALIWICLIGATASKSRPERGWFAAYLGPVAIALGYVHFNELVSSMSMFSWVGSNCGVEGRSLWSEVS